VRHLRNIFNLSNCECQDYGTSANRERPANVADGRNWTGHGFGTVNGGGRGDAFDGLISYEGGTNLTIALTLLHDKTVRTLCS
jgi:hypothetical protein